MSSHSLAKWYNLAKLPTVGDILTMRREGIDKYYDKNFEDHIENLIKLFYGRKTDEGFLSDFADAIAEADVTFTKEKSQEMQVLAGIVLRELVTDDKYYSFEIEAWTLIYHFMKKDCMIPEIEDEIIKHFWDRALQIREENEYDNEFEEIEPLEEMTEDEEGEDEGAAEELTTEERLQQLLEKTNQIVDALNDSRKELSEKTKLLHEDTQILWWLLPQYADERHKKYAEIACEEAVFLVGKDLAKRVETLPGPYAVDAIIHHMLQGQDKEKMSIEEFVNGVQDDVIEAKAFRTPLLFAMNKKRENGEAGWEKSFSEQFELNKKEQYTIFELAFEVYIESLLQKEMINE